MSICFSCFQEFDDEYDVCPYCGTERTEKPLEAVQLKPGTFLQDRYVLGYAIDSGGFGIVYNAWDNQLQKNVAIKEFFVNGIITRAVGVDEVIINRKKQDEYIYRKARFLAEARTLAKFQTHKNIVNVYDFFEANGTAYIVMELLVGSSLSSVLHQSNGKIDTDLALHITNEVGQALIALHKHRIIHRDVAPDNIFICSDKEDKIKLYDFGAAILEDSTDSYVDIIQKIGYSPVEQYSGTDNIGPWSDIYALGATLYYMLTGVKPEESTNRKKEDNLISPHELDPDISENLSNTVMKAMAVDAHMRFRTVEDFLKAVNGEKKIIPLKKEKRRRAYRKISGIAFAVFILAFAAFALNHLYNSKREIQMLNDASISIWFSVNPGSNEEEAIKSILDDFNEKFPNIKIDYKAISAVTYENEITRAAANGELPTLFESTGLSESILDASSDVSDILKSDQAATCLFLDQYDKYYMTKKQIPLAIEVPVAYIITNGNVSLKYYDDTFSSINDLGSGVGIAVDTDFSELISKNFGALSEKTKGSYRKVQFLNNQKNECAVLLSSSRAMNYITETLTMYEKNSSFYSGKTVYCRFCYEWSIGSGNTSQKRAAERLLSWMLGNKYQNILMISINSEGLIPINKECFETKTAQKNYTAIKRIYRQFVFEK